MITFLKFLLGQRALDQVSIDKSWEVVGAVIYEKVCRENADLRIDDPNYLTNEYLQERTDEIFAGRNKELVKIQENVARELDKILR